MGIRNWFSSFDDRIEREAKEEAARIVRAAKRGASKEEINRIVDDVLTPKDFTSLSGALYNSAGSALLAFNSPNRKALWKDFEMLQKACDEFHNGNFWVRSWISAKAAHDAKFPDEVILELVPEFKYLREADKWVHAALAYHICSKIEARLGPGSCSKELFHNSKNGEGTRESFKSYYAGLSPTEIAHWRLE